MNLIDGEFVAAPGRGEGGVVFQSMRWRASDTREWRRGSGGDGMGGQAGDAWCPAGACRHRQSGGRGRW